jgi:hypothetical protein
MRKATRTLVALLVIFLVFFAVGCSRSSKYEKIIAAAEKQDIETPPTTYGEAQKRYEQSDKYVDWLEKHPEDSTPEVTAKAKALRDNRKASYAAKGWDVAAGKLGAVAGKVQEGVSKTVEALKKVEVKKHARWVAGFDDPRYERFGCQDKDGNPLPPPKATDPRGADCYP